MNAFILLLSLLVVSNLAFSQTDLKIEGSCQGQLEGTDINFEYFSAFNGCGKRSAAVLAFRSEQIPKVNGIRYLGNGRDTYSFKIRGNSKTDYWLVFPDSTGNTHGEFKYRDSSGSLRSVRLKCDVYDYEYGECPSRGSR